MPGYQSCKFQIEFVISRKKPWDDGHCVSCPTIGRSPLLRHRSPAPVTAPRRTVARRQAARKPLECRAFPARAYRPAAASAPAGAAASRASDGRSDRADAGVFAEFLDILAGNSELHDCGQESRLFVVATDGFKVSAP